MNARLSSFLASAFLIISTTVFADNVSKEGKNISLKEPIIVAYYNCATGKKVIDAKDFEKLPKKEQIKIAASGFCSLGQNSNGTYFCAQGSCAGTCKLHNIPVYCGCE